MCTFDNVTNHFKHFKPHSEHYNVCYNLKFESKNCWLHVGAAIKWNPNQLQLFMKLLIKDDLQWDKLLIKDDLQWDPKNVLNNSSNPIKWQYPLHTPSIPPCIIPILPLVTKFSMTKPNDSQIPSYSMCQCPLLILPTTSSSYTLIKSLFST